MNARFFSLLSVSLFLFVLLLRCQNPARQSVKEPVREPDVPIQAASPQPHASSDSAAVTQAGIRQFTSLKCEEDQRAVDGDYRAVELTKNDAGKFDAYYHVITAGFRSPVSDTRVKIAQNMHPCTFGNEEPRLVTCRKDQRDEGETANTSFSSELINTTGVVNTEGKIRSGDHFKLTVYSPQLVGQLREGFPPPTNGGNGYFTADFNAQSAPASPLTSRCTAK